MRGEQHVPEEGIFGVSLALICVLGGFMLYQEQRCVMAVPMLNEQETAKICEQRREEKKCI